MIQETKPGLKINFWFLAVIFILILISAAITFTLSAKTNKVLNKNISATAEANRPANLDLTIITDSNCKDCFSINTILGQIEKENTKIVSNKTIDINSDEAKQLITKFSIKKLPTFLMKGELAKNSVLAKFFSQAGDTTEDTFVFRQVGGPYIDVATGKIKGRVSMLLLTDITCAQCYDVTQHEAILKQFGLQPNSKVLDIKSAEGMALKNKYGIKMIPTFVLSGDVGAYPDLKTVWPQVGMVANDGAYVFTKGVPAMGTYKDLLTNKIITPAPASNQ